jgi:thiol-disulfide isomerase/thioredoxin
MKFRILGLAAPCAAALGLLSSSQTRATPVVDGVVYEFRRPVYNGFGIEKLEELRGRPLLIEFWSYHCPPCVNSAIPDTLRLHTKYGDEMHLLFAEVDGVSENQVLSFALSQRWLETGAMWTTEQPLERQELDAPYFVLLTASGEIALEGVATERVGELDKMLESLLKEGEKAPAGGGREIARAMQELGDGNFARALELAQREYEAAGEDSLKAYEAERVLELIEERLDLKIRQVRWMLDNGYPLEASEEIEKLGKAIKGLAGREAELVDLAAMLETPELKLEAEAQRALVKIERKMFEEPDARWVKSLQKIVEKYPRTKTAERAKKLAKIAAI